MGKKDMFDLEQAISEWRQQVAAGGVKRCTWLDELESHLRDDIDALVSSGMPEDQAFRLAVSRLGDADSLSGEFKKLNGVASIPARIAAFLWVALSTALAAGLLLGVIPGNLSLLLSAHIFSLTTGYGAALLTGGLGIYYVSCRWFQVLTPVCSQQLRSTVLRFSQLSVGLVLSGLLLGMFWSAGNLKGYFAGGIREAGTLCAAVWLTAFWPIQRSGQLSDRAIMLLSIVGNVIVSLAWFGAGVLASVHGMASYWPLGTLVVVHLFFFTLGVVPTFGATAKGVTKDV